MKSKLLLLLCIVATLNFSCSDDENDKIELTAGELSISEGKFGDELIITGEGFSEIKEENIVTISDLIIPVEEATSSKLVITIPKEATTGKLSVKVEETSIDFGTFTVRKEKLFAMKSNYDEGTHHIVLIDQETGIEEPFMELPKLDKDIDIMYSSLCYLPKTREFLIMTRAEWPVRDYSILRIDIETKAIIKKEFNETDELEDIALMSDEENNVYLSKDFEWSEEEDRKTSIYEFNIETGAQLLLTEVTGDYIFDCKVNKATNQLLMVIDNDRHSDRETKLVSFDFDTEKLKEIPLTYSKSLYGFEIALDNDIYVANETVFEERKELMKINTITGAEEVITELPNPKEWYGHPTYFETNNELIYFLTDDNDVTTTILKIDLTNKTTSEVIFQASSETYYECAFSIFL